MIRTLAALTAMAALAAAPAQARSAHPATSVAVPGEIAPSQMTAQQISTLQQQLDDQGFDAGTVDGLWGPNTEAALRRFQSKHSMPVTGRLDAGILTGLGLTSTFTPVAVVATTAAPTTAAPPAATAAPPAVAATAAPPAIAAAGGNNNQAVATTAANAPVPAHGANSFTQAEAQARIGRQGYANVAALHKDQDVWRGTATKDGQTVQVWLDYKGNIGQQ